MKNCVTASIVHGVVISQMRCLWGIVSVMVVLVLLVMMMILGLILFVNVKVNVFVICWCLYVVIGVVVETNQLEERLHLVCASMSANVKAFKAFLKERQTGLVQRSKAWVKARKHTIGSSEMAVLTGASPFDTPASLLRKKLHPPNLSTNIACAWGKLFEPFARAYIEWQHNTQVFGNTISLNFAEDHPLYGKVTCSPDGYFEALDGSIVLLEFKCPFKRKIAVHKIPALYRDQIQTGLALSGELVTKGLFADCCFRMCSLSQLGMNLAHNAGPHYETIHKTKTPFPRAWGICILESKRKLTPT